MDGREPVRANSSSQPPSMMVSPNSYGVGAASNSPVVTSSGGMMQGMRFFEPISASSSAPKPMDGGPMGGPMYGDGGGPSMRQCGMLNMGGEQMRKKRGRPRKYGPDGSMALALTPMSSASGYSNSPMSDPAMKRRGRPPGSGKKQQLEALGSSGVSFTPHIITVKPGEDVASKIMAFSQQGPRTVCILSANGAICNVTLRQPATSGGTVTYEGRFEIISLSGSFLLAEDGGTRSRTGGLSVALAGSDGRVLGGCVAGMLMAATPVQVVVGSFIAEGKKSKTDPFKREPSSAPPQMAGFGPSLAASPPSEGTSSESSDDPGSPINHTGGTINNSGPHIQSPYSSVGWSLSANPNRHDQADMKMMPN
ncbi:AT-hook motif nuclear-localized protein 10 [Ananas comosus]|uniref:AT-hook motif nuclear-localized protein n=1 Tax=Ananas comosus TaxID=4615 RepID=A0A199UJT2_ANACO|nr:AT-hook motif nuclear-localized protein 10 [Ananas comosus]